MSLPSALQERLLRRGILANSAKKEKTEIIKKRQVEVEEVIAESYDEPDEANTGSSQNIANCPNRKNEFHACSSYCAQKFGVKKFDPHPVMEKRRNRMLKIYPLPLNWIEVPDPDTNRYYYWNTETNQVCWISPAHPKAKLEYSAKKKLFEAINKSANNELKKAEDKSKQTKKLKYTREELDPMDPSSYSDVPLGKWSAGLDGHSKEGADQTASGPLFQSRPYPSPGQVLKMNTNK